MSQILTTASLNRATVQTGLSSSTVNGPPSPLEKANVVPAPMGRKCKIGGFAQQNAEPLVGKIVLT